MYSNISNLESTAVAATAQENIVKSSNEEGNKTVNHFYIHRVELRGMNNYEAFDVVRRAVENGKVLRMLVTPGVDRNGCPYYWMGLRYDRNEIVFKLLVNDEISAYIVAFLKGEEDMPEVSSCVPDTVSENREEWLINHRCMLAGKASTVKEELVSSNGRVFLNTKLGFLKGKVSYSEEFSDILSFLKPDEQ